MTIYTLVVYNDFYVVLFDFVISTHWCPLKIYKLLFD